MEHFLAAYKQYANFNGRATRQQYWMFFLIYIGVSVGLTIVDMVLGMNLLASIFGLASIIPSIAIATRRLHDINKSGWLQLIVLIPVLGFFALLFFLSKETVAGENKFDLTPAPVVA